MINFKSISWMNFLSTGNYPTKVQLDRSQSTLIVGKNGGGKSTIIDALSFALYNKPFRKINKPQLINSINGKGLLVEVEFSTNNATYQVIRGIKPNRFEIYKNGILLGQDAAIKDYQEHLEKSILKMNHRSFCQVIVLGSATYVPFMQLTAHQRREIIEDLLDIQIFSTMNFLLKDRVNANRDATQKNRYDIDLASEKKALQEQLLKTLNLDISERLKARQDAVSSKTTERDELTSLETALTGEINVLSSQNDDISSVQASLSKLQSIKERLIEKVARLEKEKQFYHSHDSCPECKQGIEHDFKMGIIAAREAELTEIGDATPKLEEEYAKLLDRLGQINDAQRLIARKNNDLASVRASIRSLERTISEIKKEIAELENKTKVVDTGELEKIKKEMDDLETLRERLTREAMIISAAQTLLKDGGIKSKIIKQYVPIINKLINKYLTALDFFVHFELDENFNEVIKSRYRDDFSYQSFSEGEKLRINISILFAWRAIAKMRNSASSNLLIMDEILDGALDVAGTEEFMKLIEDLTKDTNLFVISHRGDQLADKFDSVIKFEKQGNFSVME